MSAPSTSPPQDGDAQALNEMASAKHWKALAIQYQAIARASERRVGVLEQRVDTLTNALSAAKAERRQVAQLVNAPTQAEARALSDKTKANEETARRQRDMMLRALGVKGYQVALSVIRELQALRAQVKPLAVVATSNGRPIGPDGTPCFACARARPQGGGWSCMRSAFACQPSTKAAHFIPKEVETRP